MTSPTTSGTRPTDENAPDLPAVPVRRKLLGQTVDYHGTVITVSAVSVQQAYAVAYKNVWIDPDDTHPVGIVSIHRNLTGTTLWCGCSGHHIIDGQVRHGAGVRALREAINAHHCEDTDR
jgi:hypothetical protein